MVLGCTLFNFKIHKTLYIQKKFFDVKQSKQEAFSIQQN